MIKFELMSNNRKSVKKRHKPYRGMDSRASMPQITRISAENRSPMKQWWLDHKRVVKPVSIATGVIGFVVLMILEIIRILAQG